MAKTKKVSEKARATNAYESTKGVRTQSAVSVVAAANVIQAHINGMPVDQRREANRDWQQIAVVLGLESAVSPPAEDGMMGVSVWTER